MAITNEHRVFLHVQKRTKRNRRKGKKVKRLSVDERRRLEEKKRALKRMVSPFILGESKEYNVKERDPVEEKGLRDVILDMLPRDGNNIPYVKLCGGCKRLFRISSPEFNDLDRSEKKVIYRRCLQYYFIKNNH